MLDETKLLETEQSVHETTKKQLTLWKDKFDGKVDLLQEVQKQYEETKKFTIVQKQTIEKLNSKLVIYNEKIEKLETEIDTLSGKITKSKVKIIIIFNS